MKEFLKNKLVTALAIVVAVPFVVGAGLMVGLTAPFLIVGGVVYRRWLREDHALTVLEDYGDNVDCQCSCGEKFNSDACFETNVRWTGKCNVPTCPKAPRE